MAKKTQQKGRPGRPTDRKDDGMVWMKLRLNRKENLKADRLKFKYKVTSKEEAIKKAIMEVSDE